MTYTPSVTSLLLTSSAITGGPVRTYPHRFSPATPKPSSICLSLFSRSTTYFLPLSTNKASGELLCKVPTNVLSFSTCLFFLRFFKISTEVFKSQAHITNCTPCQNCKNSHHQHFIKLRQKFWCRIMCYHNNHTFFLFQQHIRSHPFSLCIHSTKWFI